MKRQTSINYVDLANRNHDLFHLKEVRQCITKQYMSGDSCRCGRR